jgi:hypothetical protein
MEAGHCSLCDYVAGEMEKPEEIKCDYGGFTGAYAGTTEYSFDYEIHGYKPSGWIPACFTLGV